ncbi:hypothetical protein G7Y89_g10025 [Cudoniella acicularis]|uniref:Uncharacterized protein n=1 Tax=Cudoniella acicularis TaxID=354080 RepID=A0A8H4W1C1_9HELO|nr:hypothetical protein G7Y89_g10025 [Cudoniella acicularis]
MTSTTKPMEAIVEEIGTGGTGSISNAKSPFNTIKEVDETEETSKEGAAEGNAAEKEKPLATTLHRSLSKSKSLSAAELAKEVINDGDIAKIRESFAEEPPMSLEEARQRRASIKEERKRSIDFIRSRTTSRAGMGGRPSIEDPKGA